MDKSRRAWQGQWLRAHHRIAPCHDRIFEGLRREDDGTYCISTGS